MMNFTDCLKVDRYENMRRRRCLESPIQPSIHCVIFLLLRSLVISQLDGQRAGVFRRGNEGNRRSYNPNGSGNHQQ